LAAVRKALQAEEQGALQAEQYGWPQPWRKELAAAAFRKAQYKLNQLLEREKTAAAGVSKIRTTEDPYEAFLHGLDRKVSCLHGEMFGNI